ncbi:MAG: HNH endonuclease [Atribacterota bacterium]
MGLPESKRKLLIEFVNGYCERCHKKKPLEIHRINRGYKGGVYQLRNILILCNDCHKLIHQGEFK